MRPRIAKLRAVCWDGTGREAKIAGKIDPDP